MYISEIDNQSITLHSYKDEKETTLVGLIYSPATPAQENFVEAFKQKYPKLKFCILEPIREEDKLINFEGDTVTDLIAGTDKLPIIWSDVKIVNMYLPEKGAVHFVISNDEGTSTNRRNGFRISLNIPCNITYKDTLLENVTIRDLSVSGIGLNCKKAEYEIGENIQICFEDEGRKFVLNASIVRTNDNERCTFLGCKFRNTSNVLAQYINSKQQKKAKLL
ncbi:MAG: PilZ domain-containing protein [Agathobacter sp.]|nr:PilZ domain-containing protein [Agathobacter sp.]